MSNVLGYNYNYYEHTERVNYAQSIYDSTLDRSYEFDQVVALVIAHSGAEARASAFSGQWGIMDGPYSQGYDYDKFGNMTRRYGWGGEVQGGTAGQDSDKVYTYSNNKNQRDGFTYDAAGNLTNDQAQSYSYDATGQQATAASNNYFLQQGYDGNGLRAQKTENGAVTYYVRSSVLGGSVVAEIDGSGTWQRGYVYAGGDLLAVQQGGVNWVHEDSVTKSKRITDIYGNIVSTVELDPWGADTNRSSNVAFLPQNFTSYIRDANGGQDAMARRYSASGRFSQPDPYGGSYDFSDPQSLNRYAYTKNDPVNFRDPSGLDGLPSIGWYGLPPLAPPSPTPNSGFGGSIFGDGMFLTEERAGIEGVQDGGGLQNSGTAKFPCTFNVNVTNSGLTPGELQAAEDEIRAIYGAANLGVVFGNPRLANGGSVSLNIGTNFSRAGQRLLGRGGEAANGVAVLGRAYVSITNTVTLNGTVQATTSAIRALSVGRVAAHEITHGLGRQGEGSGLMRGAFGSELFDPNAQSQFRLTGADTARLLRRCRGRRR